MLIYVVKSPASEDYLGRSSAPETILAYYSSREAVERHIEDNPDTVIDVDTVDVRAMYNPEDPAPVSTLVYGGYMTVSGQYTRGWLDNHPEKR